MLPEMIDKLISELFLAQDRLAPHFRPDGFADPPLNELPVFFLCRSPLPAELAEHQSIVRQGCALSLPAVAL